MVDVVFLIVDAWSDQGEGGGGLTGGEEAALRGGVAAGFNENIPVVTGAAHTQVEALVRFLQNKGWRR